MKVPSISDIQVLRGDVEAMSSLWSAGAPWRRTIGRIIGELQSRYSRSVEFLRPPIWPIGVINVFGLVLVATEEGWNQCRLISSTERQLEACWECLCFAEQIVDALLIAELFVDRVRDVLFPVLAAMKAGGIPIGYQGGVFVCVDLIRRSGCLLRAICKTKV